MLKYKIFPIVQGVAKLRSTSLDRLTQTLEVSAVNVIRKSIKNEEERQIFSSFGCNIVENDAKD